MAMARGYETAALTPRLGWAGVELGWAGVELGWAGDDELACLISSGRMQMRRLSPHAFLGSLDHTGTRTGRTRFSHWS